MSQIANPKRTGCWTCRMRHRKCDEAVPECEECSSRQIPCYGYDLEPPDWMNDERKLKSELQNIKHAVKQNFRRVKRLQSRSSSRHMRRGSDKGFTQASLNSPDSRTETYPESDSTLSLSENTSFKESQHLIHYLDYIWPLKYPYYVDDPDLGGRGWLFWLLTKSAPLRHAALTLSALHQHYESRYRVKRRESDLIQYHTKALQELRQVLSRRPVQGFGNKRGEWVEFMAGGLALISFQIFQGGTSNWEPHLSALGSVLDEITPSELQIQDVELVEGTDFPRGMKIAQRFLISCLLWFDILACVSTGTAPKIPYHQWLNTPEVDMSKVMGCQNWMMILVADIATLDATIDQLTAEALTSRIMELKDKIHLGVEILESEQETRQTRISRPVTRVYAKAALVQLSTLAARFRLPTSGLHASVESFVTAMKEMPEGVSLRGLTWCLCVAGCMARSHQRLFFEDILQDILEQSDSEFSNCGTVLRILQHCWSRQDVSPNVVWTLRRSMEGMGICALLV